MNTKTTNGMPAFTTTLNNCVDLFYNIGASRGRDIIPAFSKASSENKDYAIRIAQWARDVRGGSGERQLYKDILLNLAKTDMLACSKLIAKTPEIGRFDDLLVLIGTNMELDVLNLIKAELDKGNGLCAKWMPRKGPEANRIRRFLKLTPKEYRKTIVGLTKVVEQDMCAKNWTGIDYSKLPSVASARYQKAFSKNDGERYGQYISALEKGETKINAGAVYPYNIVQSIKSGISRVADQQWLALPNYMEGSTERILPLVDVSGSMDTPAGKNANVTCMDVAISLGLYISERGTGMFKNKFLTFTSTPKLESLSGTLTERVRQLNSADWGGSTNIEAAFKTILTAAKMYNVPAEHMPTKLLILSDMQFDCCGKNLTDSAMSMITRQYEEAGYKVPAIIFWNLNASGNVPTTFNKVGAALVSGFSPALMKGILACEYVTPEQMMIETINVPRYDWE